jgi:hypothetical protein
MSLLPFIWPHYLPFLFLYYFLLVEKRVEESRAERQQSCVFSFGIQYYISIIKLIWDSPAFQRDPQCLVQLNKQ